MTTIISPDADKIKAAALERAELAAVYCDNADQAASGLTVQIRNLSLAGDFVGSEEEFHQAAVEALKVSGKFSGKPPALPATEETTHLPAE